MAIADPARLDQILTERLAALGHAPDFIDDDAARALVAYAGGSASRLRAALAGALFLASTEDATRVDRSLVERALRDEAGPDAPISSPVPQAWTRPRAASLGVRLMLPSLVAALLGLDYLAWGPGPHPPVAVPATAPPYLAGNNIVPGPAQQVEAPAPPKPESGPTAALPAAPPQPPPAVPASAPHPSTPSAKPQDSLPVAPPATVLVRFHDGDPVAAKRAVVVAQVLRRAGIERVVARPSLAGVSARPIAYFYVDDLNFAWKVTQILSSEPGTGFGDDVLVPKLAMRSLGMPVRQPGLVEIHLP